MHIPTVDIGMRQQGRLRSASVIHCEDDTDEIASAISLALSDRGRELARAATNPYYKPDTLRLITETIATVPLESLKVKHFHDING